MKNFVTLILLLLIAPLGLQAQMGMSLQNSKNTPFISTWNTANLFGAGPTNEIILPLKGTGDYAFTVDWGDGNTSFVTNANMLTAATHTYAAAGIYTLTITGKINGWQFTDPLNPVTTGQLKIIDVSQWGCLQGAGEGAFWACSNLDVSATDSLNVEGITSFRSQFLGCSSLTSLNVTDWDVSQGTDFANQFLGTSLTTLDVSNWDVSQGTIFGSQFGNCSNLTTLDVSNWDVSQGDYFGWQFWGCSSLVSLDVSNWDVSQGVVFASQFQDCTSLTTLDVSNWNVGQGTFFKEQFASCVSLTTLDVSNWDVGQGTNFQQQFTNCIGLTTLDVSNWDVGQGTNFRAQFQGCTGLTNLDVSNWDVSQATSMTSFMLGAATTTILYDQTLINWEALTLQPGVSVHFGSSLYTAGGAADTARTNIITLDSWTITDGGSI
ncbi:BspA family leucine-rich repeat surface protein [Spongiimicrobium sp. 3-5]|uniref:BspA family leucine-rich repeat surface protein n=1 Tax=Spongiimicrobium sp. 3-5 TaxID=3332596 RepID=UPI0039807256